MGVEFPNFSQHSDPLICHVIKYALCIRMHSYCSAPALAHGPSCWDKKEPILRPRKSNWLTKHWVVLCLVLIVVVRAMNPMPLVRN